MTYDGRGDRIERSSPSSTSVFPLGDNYEVTDGVATKDIALPSVGLVIP